MKFGIIARADRGGLASMTYEVFRHLNPDRVLIFDLRLAARGGLTDITQYEKPGTEVFVSRYHRSGFEIEQFLQGLDVVYSAETVYEDHVYTLARGHRVATVLHVMPELFGTVDRLATELWLPTTWEAHRIPKRARLVPMPVALDKFEYRRRKKVDTLFATTGEAMKDRNGWEIVQAAMKYVEHPVRLLWRGGPPQDPPVSQVGNVTMVWLPPVERYEQVIPAETDLMLMPRRYGGLCLPVQEAAAQGIPTVMTNLSPQKDWGPSGPLIPVKPLARVNMKGGRDRNAFELFDAEPDTLAWVINAMIEHPGQINEASLRAREWAEARSWDVMLPDWQERLEKLTNAR